MFEETQRQNRITQEALLRFLQNTPPNDSFVSAPRTKSDIEFRIEALSSSITEFSFDPETNSTFANWYSRYADLFTQDACNLDEQAKIRLLLRRLDTPAHFKYTNYILPRKPADFTFDETIAKLKKIFDKQQSLFNLRFKCFQIIKKDDMSNLSYMGLINKSCEEIQFNTLTIDQLKCLLYIAGLQSSRELLFRPKLLAKMECDQSTITLQQLSDEYERLQQIRKDSEMIQKFNDDTSIFHVQSENTNSNESISNSIENVCLRCGKFHQKNNCPAFDEVCGFCNIKGHLQDFCFKKQKPQSSGIIQPNRHLIPTTSNTQ